MSTVLELEEGRVHHEQLKEKLFPLKKHPLYGDVTSFDKAPYLMPAALADFTNETDFEDTTNLEICPSCFFNTSGTTNRSKKIPFSDADLARQRAHEAIALSKLGMGDGDGVMSLGAPLPSISGWAIVNGSEATGARALNTSQLDYDTIFEKAWGNDVTFVIGTPLVVKEIGRAIEEEFGYLRNVLPNLKTAVIFGDVLPDALREELKNLWGFQNVYSLYGTVEADVVATECTHRQGEMNLMSERLIFEFLPEGELAKEREDSSYIAQSMPINQVENGSFGEILISDLSRDTLPLIRYRIGDIIKVHRGTGVHNVTEPTVSVLGRSKNTVMLNGVAIYEMQLDSALKAVFKESLMDWKLVENNPDSKTRYDLQVLLKNEGSPTGCSSTNCSSTDFPRLFDALRGQRHELKPVRLEQLIAPRTVKEFARAEIAGDTKAQRITLL